MFLLTLLLIAFILSVGNKRKLGLVLALGGGLFLPYQLLIDYYYLWYCSVIVVDGLIAWLAIKLDDNLPLFVISALLCVLHATQCFYNKPFNYYILANCLELLQVISLIITSPIIITKIKGRIKCLQKFGCGY